MSTDVRALSLLQPWPEDLRALLAERDRLDRILREVTARAMGIPEPRTFTGTIDFIEHGDQDTRTGGLAAEVAELRRHVHGVAAAREEGRRAGIEEAAKVCDAYANRSEISIEPHYPHGPAARNAAIDCRDRITALLKG